jgi:superfamily I DNA/RNA helicase
MEDVPKEHLTNILILVRNYCYAIPYMRWFKDHDLAFGPLKDDKKHPIRIGTIHESKGAEADNVVLDLNMTRKSWDVLPTDEEKRVWYTGITRAKRNLYLMMPRARCNAENLLA